MCLEFIPNTFPHHPLPMSMFGFGGAAVAVALTLNPSKSKTTKENGIALSPEQKDCGAQLESVHVFEVDEDVSGTVSLTLPQGKKLEHLGVKVGLFGRIEMFYDKGNHYDFTSLVKELEVAGTLFDSKEFQFEFKNVEMPYESYKGLNVRLRYFVRATVTRSYNGTITKECEYAVQMLTIEPEINNSIKMEVSFTHCFSLNFISNLTHLTPPNPPHPTHPNPNPQFEFPIPRSELRTASTLSLSMRNRNTTSMTSLLGRFTSFWCESRSSTWSLQSSAVSRPERGRTCTTRARQ